MRPPDNRALAADVAQIQQIPAVETMLLVICRAARMGFAAVARVTADRWIACAVQDEIQFGLRPGGELEVGAGTVHRFRDSPAAR
jgi:hypothetical protein